VRRILSRHQGRSDDTPGVAHGRLRVYHDQTEPLVTHYEDRALLRRVDGTRDVASVELEVHAELARGAPLPGGIGGGHPPECDSALG